MFSDGRMGVITTLTGPGQSPVPDASWQVANSIEPEVQIEFLVLTDTLLIDEVVTLCTGAACIDLYGEGAAEDSRSEFVETGALCRARTRTLAEIATIEATPQPPYTGSYALAGTPTPGHRRRRSTHSMCTTTRVRWRPRRTSGRVFKASDLSLPHPISCLTQSHT